MQQMAQMPDCQLAHPCIFGYNERAFKNCPKFAYKVKTA
jgi:hypothetical protein